jgi:hypothetical protein
VPTWPATHFAESHPGSFQVGTASVPRTSAVEIRLARRMLHNEEPLARWF